MQSYANHRRYNPIYHYFAAPLAYVATIWGLIRLVRAPSADTALLAVMCVGLGGVALASRAQVLIVQNRVIRLEMALRFARVLPADLAARAHELRTRQVVALRFAGDAELPDLTRRALAGEFPSPRDIKMAIRDWQADNLRA